MSHKDSKVEELIIHGENLFNEGKIEEAEKYFINLLSHYPSNPDIRNNLGAIKYSQGDILLAKEFFLSALALDADYIDALSNLKELYIEYGTWQEYPQALADAKTLTSFFEEAFRLDPKDPGIQNDIGIIQINAGDITNAELSFHAAINLDPGYQEAFYNLGKVLLSQERYAEAIDNFIAAIILDPKTEIAQRAALEYQNEGTIEKIRNKYKNILIVPDKNENNMAILTPMLVAIKELYPSNTITIFKSAPIETFDNVDDVIAEPNDKSYDIAMITSNSADIVQEFKSWFDLHCEQLFLSSPLGKPHNSYKYFHFARCLGYIGEQSFEYTSNKVQNNLKGKYHSTGMNQRAILLGGTGRSGTTLITRILNKHNALAAFGEVKVLTNGIDDLLQIFRQSQISRKKHIDDFKRKWTNNYYEFIVPWENKNGDKRRGLVHWFSIEEILECLTHLDGLNALQTLQAGYRTYGNFIQSLFNLYAQKEGKLYWAEKTPANAIYAPILNHCFSDMKIVNMIRDGRDVACSLMREGWGTKDPYKAIDWWASGLIKALEGQKLLPPESYLNVRYEDLINDPENTMKQVINFLQLDWDENVLNEPFYSKSLKRYKSELSKDVQQYVLEKYSNLLRLFAYI